MTSPGTNGPPRRTGSALAGAAELATAPSTRLTTARRRAAPQRSVGHEFTREDGRSRGRPTRAVGRVLGGLEVPGPEAPACGTARGLRSRFRARNRDRTETV